jgi:hypothetical protein
MGDFMDQMIILERKKKKKIKCDHFVHIYSKLDNLYILIKVYKDDKLF